MPKVLTVGLEKRPLQEDELEGILVELENRIRGFIERRLGRRLDELDITITADLKNGGRGLDIVVDVRAIGRVIAPMTYDEVVAEAIEEAVKWLEERLRGRGVEEASGKSN